MPCCKILINNFSIRWHKYLSNCWCSKLLSRILLTHDFYSLMKQEPCHYFITSCSDSFITSCTNESSKKASALKFSKQSYDNILSDAYMFKLAVVKHKLQVKRAGRTRQAFFKEHWTHLRARVTLSGLLKRLPQKLQCFCFLIMYKLFYCFDYGFCSKGVLKQSK